MSCKMARRSSMGAALLASAWIVLGAGCSVLRNAMPGRPARQEADRPQLAVSTKDLATNLVAAPAATQRVAEVSQSAPYRLRPGDPVVIYLRGILPRDDEVQDIVDEMGAVTLPYIDDVQAAGRTVSELERHIQRVYIERQIYRSVTVNVVMPSQSFFVQGEVRGPQRYPLITGMTVMQAVAAAGGYTEFADPRRVMLTRGGVARTINMRDIERNPKLDIMIESGDVIRVPRSIF